MNKLTDPINGITPVLVAMKGLPRSGKSTIVEGLAHDLKAPIVRRDAIRLALHGIRFKPEAEPMVKALSTYMIRALFLAGHEWVICDETNFSKAARQSLLSPDWETVFYEVSTSPEICMDRALATGQPDLIPIIDGMWQRHEPLDETEIRYNPETLFT